MAEHVLRLPEPLFITLQSPDGATKFNIDVFVARRMLNDAEKQPTEEARWGKVLTWLGEKLSIQPELLAENMAIVFNNAVMELHNRVVPELKKEHFKTASLGESIPASQEAIQNGQSS